MHGLKRESNEIQHLHSTPTYDICWDQKVTLPAGFKKNTPDIMVWDKTAEVFSVTGGSCPMDMRIVLKCSEKRRTYMPFGGSLKRLYNNYKYKITSVIIRALGLYLLNLHSWEQ